MHIKTLSIRNFRILERIDVEFTDGVNVIVGPNAAGKTTILEAIRLAKAMLAPRTGSESQQTLISLGAVSPHNPQQLIFDGLVRDPNRKLEIRCGYQLSADELAILKSAIPQITTNYVVSRLGQNLTPASLAAFLSSEQGKAELRSGATDLEAGIKRIEAAGNICRLDLEIDFQSSQISTPDPIGAAMISFLDQSLPPRQTKFSYFPADRALPRGEVPIQIGTQDAGQQIESHNSQPQLKYGRLKNEIFNTIIQSEDGREQLKEEFKLIFSGILKGRELVGAGISQHGLLSIKVKDLASGYVFDLDGMSSGEKGLVLTFLLIGRSAAKDGMVLLDEPELHLNPAVCKDLLSFIVDNYANPKSLQLLVCSHSPEILAGAFDREECALYHLESPTKLSRVSRSDGGNIADALRRLGTSESEGLLYKGTIFVEGVHDVELLESGFPSVLKNYKLKDLGGRQEVEKQIRQLQTAEENGVSMTPRYFIFDRDDAPANLKNSAHVKILQWERRCLENYLIDIAPLSELLCDSDVTKSPLKGSGEVAILLKALAMGHLDDEVIRSAYASYHIRQFGLRPSVLHGKSFKDAAAFLFGELAGVQKDVCSLTQDEWVAGFEKKCAELYGELFPIWDANWRDLCDGKRLFNEVRQKVTLTMPMLSFKKRILLQMRANASDSWRTVESMLKELISGEFSVLAKSADTIESE